MGKSVSPLLSWGGEGVISPHPLIAGRWIRETPDIPTKTECLSGLLILQPPCLRKTPVDLESQISHSLDLQSLALFGS